MNPQRFSKIWVPIAILAILAVILIGSTTSVQAQTGMPSTIPNPGVPIDEAMKHALPYLIDVEGDYDYTLLEEGDQIVVQDSNGNTVAAVNKGEENFIVEGNYGTQGTGTIWRRHGQCWWINQIYVHGQPVEVEILKGDDIGGESTIWCTDGTVKLIERGERDDHNGQEIIVTEDGKVLIDGVEKVTSGVSTCAAVVETKSGALHRIEQFTELSPGSRQGLLHPSVLLLGSNAGYENLNRGSAVGIWEELANKVCPKPVVVSCSDGKSLFGICLPLIVNGPLPTIPPPTPSCPFKFGFSDGPDEPTQWYSQGQDYPTQQPNRRLWVKFTPLPGYYIMTASKFTDMSGAEHPIDETYPGAGGVWPDWTFKWVDNTQPGHYETDTYQRVNGQDRWLEECNIKIDDAGPPTVAAK